MQLGPKFIFSSVLATNLEDCTGITSRCGKRHNRAASSTEAPLPIWIHSSCRIVTLKVFQHLENYKDKLTTENSLDARHFSGGNQHFLNTFITKLIINKQINIYIYIYRFSRSSPCDCCRTRPAFGKISVFFHFWKISVRKTI